MVPLHHQKKLTKSGEYSPPVPPYPPQRGGGTGRPLRKLRQKTARRYKNCASLQTVLHGSDVIVCPSSNIGTHKQRWRRKTCALCGEDRGGGTGEGGGDGAGGNHHGTRPTGGSCRQRLLRMRAPVVVQDHAMWLPSGGPQLRVLLVSGAVRQRCAPDLSGQAADDAGENSRRRGAARWGRGRGADAKAKAGETQDAKTTGNAKTKAGGTQESGTTQHAVRPSKLPGTEAAARRRGVADATEETEEGEGVR